MLGQNKLVGLIVTILVMNSFASVLCQGLYMGFDPSDNGRTVNHITTWMWIGFIHIYAVVSFGVNVRPAPMTHRSLLINQILQVVFTGWALYMFAFGAPITIYGYNSVNLWQMCSLFLLPYLTIIQYYERMTVSARGDTDLESILQADFHSLNGTTSPIASR